MASCTMYPKVASGEDSKTYKELLTTKGIDRPMANYIYANYLLSGVQDAMDRVTDTNGNPKYPRNTQGEHYAMDINEFFNIPALLAKMASSNISELARRFGAKDNAYNNVLFASPETALNLARRINSNSEEAVAWVSKQTVGPNNVKYVVNVERRDANNAFRTTDVEATGRKWDIIKQKLTSLGVDTDGALFDKERFNPVSTHQFLGWLENMLNYNPSFYQNLSKGDLKTLFALNPNSQRLDRLKQRLEHELNTTLSDMEAVADAVWESYHGGVTLNASAKDFVKNTLTAIKTPPGLTMSEITSLKQQIDNERTIVEQTKEGQIVETIKELKQKYPDAFAKEILLIGNELKDMESTMSKALMLLKRDRRTMKDKNAPSNEISDVETLMTNVEREINTLNFGIGSIQFLDRALADIQKTLNEITNTPAQGTDFETSIALSTPLERALKVKDQYKLIAKSLTQVKNFPDNGSIADVDVTRIIDGANKVLDLLEEFDAVVKEVSKQNMSNLLVHTLGESLENGLPIATLVEQMDHSSTLTDWLYSWGRVSNPVIAAMGTMTRDIQNERDAKLANVALRIRREQAKLRRAGNASTRFMYEDNGYIISDIDFDKYNRDRNRAYGAFVHNGLKGFALEHAMDQWEEQHTEDRVVDLNSGRTERIPNRNYRKAFPSGLTNAQMTYYQNMMQIKGELGTLLPTYAQKHYLPPQIRRSFIDAISDAFKEKHTIHHLIKALRTQIQNIYTIREDDTRFYKNGIVNGEEFGIMEGDVDDTEMKRIPIYYLNRLQDQDQGELLKDFSGALQHFASSAINYEYMSQMRDTIEFMKDYFNSTNTNATRGNLNLKDIFTTNGLSIISDLRKKSDILTPGLIQGFVDYHYYGKKLASNGKWTKVALSLLGYTSKRHLTVNLKGAISNELVGELQMMIEAGAGEFYNRRDLAWAHGMLIGTGINNSWGALMDFAFNNESTMPVLLARRFNPKNDNFTNMSHGRYHTNFIRHMVSTDLSFIGYGIGEDIIHNLNMYAVLKHTKVKLNGKTVSLYDVLGKSDKEDGSSELIIKPNATYIDEQGVEKPIDDEFLDTVRDRIRYVNQTTHGSMNNEDKGLIHRYIAGKFIMNLRQWMVEHYSRRYRKRHWDYTLKQYREGYWSTTNRYLGDKFLEYGGLNAVNYFRTAIGKEALDFDRRVAMHWSTMSVEQKANVRRAREEFLILMALLALQAGLGAPADHKGEFLRRMAIYQTKRAITDVWGSMPIGLVYEAQTLINSPISATSTVVGTLYPILGIADLFDEVKSGRHKGENKYWWKIKRYTLPYYYQLEQLYYMSEDEGLFNFDKSII